MDPQRRELIYNGQAVPNSRLFYPVKNVNLQVVFGLVEKIDYFII